MWSLRKSSAMWAGVLLVALGGGVLGLAGCGATGAGTFSAQLRQIGDVRPELWSRLQGEMATAPEQLTLRGDGSFTLMRGAEEVWRGKWRLDGESLVLRATTVKGVAVQESLQGDVTFEKREGGGYVDSRTRQDGYVREYVAQ